MKYLISDFKYQFQQLMLLITCPVITLSISRAAVLCLNWVQECHQLSDLAAICDMIMNLILTLMIDLNFTNLCI